MTQSAVRPLTGQPLRRLVQAMPKAELHLHLDGSVRIDTALDLAQTRGIDAPRDWVGMSAALIAPMPCADQAELLRTFDLPIALMQDAEALERITALRSHEPAANVVLAETAARFRDRGLTGWDLAGPEAAFPDPLFHGMAFEAARAGGLRITLHAGEWGGSAQVRRALALEPERIAHGPGAVDDPALCAELIARGVTLDLCPTSNAQAGIVPSVADHPLARLQRAGVSVTLSTDDTTVSDLTLSEEYLRAVEVIGLTLPELWAMDRRALEVAFATDADTAPLRHAFRAWGATIPELEQDGGPRARAGRGPGTQKACGR